MEDVPMRVRDLMKPEPLALAPDARLLEILHLFVQAQIGAAPVVDEHGAVRGMISRADLLAAIDQIVDEDVDPGEAEDADPVARLQALTALDLATPAVWVAPDARISQVAQRMRELGVHHVLVGTDGRLAGLLTALDLLQAVRS